MKKREARRAAERWMAESGKNLPGLVGAYYSGSFLTAGEEEEWPESSDIDVMLVFEAGKKPGKLGKFRTEGVLLEGSCLEESELSALEHVLSTHYLAFAMNAGELLYDPKGLLGRIHRETAACYGERRWVMARCGGFLEGLRKSEEAFDVSAQLPQKVNSWLFPTGITCFPILCAALENCTVRKRYSAARKVLEQYDMLDFYKRLLSLLVPERLERKNLLEHLGELEVSFRLATASSGPSASYAFRADISPEGASVAIGGSRELILSFWPEEAVFWMAATFSRCHTILSLDDPKLEAARRPAFLAFLEDLGIREEEDFVRRNAQRTAFLPELEETAKKILEIRENKEKSC